MNKLIFRCWACFNDGGWEQIERDTKLKLRLRPRWLPFKLWLWFLNRLFHLEATLEAPNGYIDDATITVADVEMFDN